MFISQVTWVSLVISINGVDILLRSIQALLKHCRQEATSLKIVPLGKPDITKTKRSG
jgi:hypothetical protein